MLPSLGVAHAYMRAFDHTYDHGTSRVRCPERRPTLERVRIRLHRRHR